MQEQAFSTQKLDHLGIVAGICREIDLIGQIDTYVGPTGRKVSVGEAVQAMVLNALGFVGRALYLTPEFFANKPVDILIREGLEAEDFNDDSMGRAMDCLYDVGVTEVFGCVASHALGVYGIKHRFAHLDSSTFSFHGRKYEAEDTEAISITNGYSKDKRPDLKQAVLNLICSYRSSIPAWLEALSGNSSDKTSFAETIKAYVEQMKGSEAVYFIADSALYSEDNLKELSRMKWVTRVPATLGEVKKLYEAIELEDMASSEEEGYKYCEVCSTYGGVKQRWIVVFSQKGYNREVVTFQKQLEKKRDEAEKELWHLGNKEFEREEEARLAVEAMVDKWKFHEVDFQVEPVAHYGKSGRPKTGEEPERVGWCVVGEVVEKEDAIAEALKTKGKFVIATNELDCEKLGTEEMLKAYKGQGVSVERGFRFLKDPLFFASSLFLEKPERIMALLMIMGLALLVYALAERKLREQLKLQGESIPNQVGKPTQNPTMRRVFQVFEGIDVLLIPQSNGVRRLVLNLKPIHIKILDLLGEEVQKCYFSPG